MNLNALIITTAGTNCDAELGRAFELAGTEPTWVHLNRLMADPALIEPFDLIGLPGGFSYGDAIAAGRIAAALMKRTLYPALVRAIERGVPIIAPCNGFQVAVQMGLLPGPPSGEQWPSRPAQPVIALTNNESARFCDRWCGINVPTDTHCIWTRGLQLNDHTALLPVAHGEGRFIVEHQSLLRQLEEHGQIAMRYAAGDNPNGSIDDVAGICDATGLVLGLMPHPERYTRWEQHPFWTRLSADQREGDPPGLQMFRKAVSHVRERGARGKGRVPVAVAASAR